MRKFTKVMLTLALLVGAVGSANAGKFYGNLTATGGFEATWNGETQTMGWNSVGNYYPNFRILLTGLPAGNITEYTKFHATLSDFSDNATYVRLRFKSNDGSDHYADVNLVAGENNIDLVVLRESFPDCDFTNIVDITIWSPESAEEGKTVDADHPASVKIENVYLQTPRNIASNSFGDEITSLDDILDGTKFAIGDGSKAMYWVSGGVDAQNSVLNSVPNEAYCYYILEKVDGLDTDGDEVVEDDNYRLKIVNASETAFPHPWGMGSYLNYSMYGHLWAASCAEGVAENFGGDGQYYAIWKVGYMAGNGFSLKNVGCGKYAKINGTDENLTYLRFYKEIVFNINTELDKENNEANDAIFAFSNATGYDEETGTLTNGTWTFETPVDVTNWDYLVITTIDNASDQSRMIRITDDNGVSVAGSDYAGQDAGTGDCSMYFDQYNNQNAIRISLEYLRTVKNLECSKIKSLTIKNSWDNNDCVIRVSNVYLTDYNNTKIRENSAYSTGDVVRNYDITGKFGTICLPYKAASAGAEIYSIESKNANGISLTKVTGLLEAGKPYFYVSSDENGQSNAGAVRNVHFFRADFDTYDAASPVENNGLIGTFTGTTAPAGSNYYILSRNQLYQVGPTNAVTVGANKAYVDVSKITDLGGAGSRAFINFDAATGIEETMTVKNQDNGAIYTISGQRVKQLGKGLFIVNGKKMIIR